MPQNNPNIDLSAFDEVVTQQPKNNGIDLSAFDETVKKKNGQSVNGTADSPQPLSQDGEHIKTPIEILNESGGNGSLVPKISSEPVGNPPFANPSKVAGGYDWDKVANVIGHVEGEDVAAPSGNLLEKGKEMLGNVPNTLLTASPLLLGAKVGLESGLGSLQGVIQGAEEMGVAETHLMNPEQMKSNWQYLELPAAMVKTGFSAAALINPEVAAFMAATNEADKILPSDFVATAMSPFSTLLQKSGGKLAFRWGNQTRIWDLGSPDHLKAAAELTDLLYQIILFHGTKELASKVAHNEWLAPIEQKEVNAIVDKALKEDVVPVSKEALDKIPANAPDEVKINAAPLIEEKQNLETQKQELTQQKSKVDENFHPKIDEEIKATEEKITEANEKLKSITEQKKQDTRTEEPAIEKGKTKGYLYSLGSELQVSKRPDSIFEVKDDGTVLLLDSEQKRALTSIEGFIKPLYDIKEYASSPYDKGTVLKEPKVSIDVEGNVTLKSKGEITYGEVPKSEPIPKVVEEKVEVVENVSDSGVSGGKETVSDKTKSDESKTESQLQKERVQKLGNDETAMPQSEVHDVLQLRRERDNNLRRVEEQLRTISERYGGKTDPKTFNRKDRQQWKLLQRELQVGYDERAASESQGNGKGNIQSENNTTSGISGDNGDKGLRTATEIASGIDSRTGSETPTQKTNKEKTSISNVPELPPTEVPKDIADKAGGGEQSLKDKVGEMNGLGTRLANAIDKGEIDVNKLSEKEQDVLYGVADGLSEDFVMKHIEGRVSMKAMETWTPEKLEQYVDEKIITLKSIEENQKITTKPENVVKIGETKSGGDKGVGAVLQEGNYRISNIKRKYKGNENADWVDVRLTDKEGNTHIAASAVDKYGSREKAIDAAKANIQKEISKSEPTQLTEPQPKTKLQLAKEKFENSFKQAQENRRKNDQNLGIVSKSEGSVKKQAELDRQTFDDLVDYAREGINEGFKTAKEFLERIPDEAKRIAEIAWKVANNTLKYEDAVGMIESEAMKRELTESERLAADRLTDNPIKDTEPPIPTEELPKDTGNKEKIRKVFDAFMNRSQINDAAKKLLKENPNNTYVVFNALAKHEVIELSKVIIDRIGVEEALKEATNMENGFLPRERILMLGGVVSELNAKVSKAKGAEQIELSNQEIDAYNKLINQATDFAATYATDMGQAIEAIKNIYKMSAISVMRKLKQTLDTANEMNAPNAQRTVDAVIKELQDENKHLRNTAEELNNLDASQKATIEQLQKELRDAIRNAKSKESKLGSKENPIKVIKEVSRNDFDAALKRLGGKLRTGLSPEDLIDLDTVATFAIQKGIGKFSEFFDTLKKSLPNKYHEAIEDAYKSARDKSIEAGEAKETFDADEVIADVLDSKSKETDAKVITDRTARIAKAKLESVPDKARELAPKVAAKRILQDAKSTLEIGSTKNEKKYLNNLVNAIVSKAQEIYKDQAPTKPSVDDWLRIAIENLRHTDSLWKDAQRKVEEKLDADTRLTESEKDSVKSFLDDYLQSTIDVLLTEPKKREIVRQKLIEAGYFKEVTKDGKTTKAIDWNKIVGNENTIAEAKAKIRSTIEGLGLPKEDTNSVIESIIHQFDEVVKDKRATEINKYLNKYNINKAKNVIGKGNRKRNVDKLIEYQDKGILTDERAREVLSKELGLTTITPEEFARVNELVELIRNTKTPSAKKKFEEELEYIFATKNGNFEYEVTKSRMLSNALGSIPNMIQNAVSGFGVTINQAVSAAIKTGDPIGALKVALRGLEKGFSDAKHIFLEGGVGRGSAFSDYTLTTEGAPRLRILEHKKGGRVFWIVPDIYIKAGKTTFNANDIILNQTGKWTSRVLEATDALNSSPISEVSQFVNLFNQIKRDNPTLSKKQIRDRTFDEMYKKKMPEAIREAIDDLINNAKIPNPTKTQIQRAAYELIETQRREDVVGRGERDAARFTGRKSTYGITTPITWVLQGLQQKIGEAKRLNAASSKYRRYAANTADFTVNTAIPFANGIARWIELQMELVAPYGLLKAGAYKTAAEIIKRTPKYQEKYDYKEIQSLANTFALRAAIGTAEAIAVGTILASLTDEDEEWIKGIDILGTPYGKKQISNIIQPENTISIAGHYIPLYLIGGIGMSMGLYATLRDAMEAQQITPEHFRKSETALGFIALSQILSNVYGQRASRFGSLITGWYGKDFDKNFGKFLGRNARNYLPGAQLQYDIYQMTNPESKESENFHENLLMQTGYYGGWAGKDAFDYRGRPFDIGQASPLSPDGLIKMFEKNERADGIDKLLAKAGYNHNDVDQKNERYYFKDEDGVFYPQDLDEDKQYDFRKLAAQKFNDKLTEYQDALQSAANLKDLDYYTPEEIVRRYASILHSLSNDEAYKEIMPDAVLSEAELKIEEKFKDLESKLIGLQTGITVPLEIENSLKDIEGVIGTIEQKQQSMQPVE